MAFRGGRPTTVTRSVRFLTTTAPLRTPKPARPNHYESLGITSKATQADVKSAYYKLSMIYHPDRNVDNASAEKQFRDITEAYEVLGNLKSRKLYDRSLVVGGTGTVGGFYDSPEPMGKFYQSREVRSKPPAPYGRTTVYDFDEWSKAHYGATFMRDQMNKERRNMEAFKKREVKQGTRNENVIYGVATFFLLFGLIFMDRGQFSSDNVSHNKSRPPN